MSRIDDADPPHPDARSSSSGLFEQPLRRPLATPRPSAAPRTGRSPGRRCASRRSLLKNTGVLPLATTGGKIFVAGKSADDIGNQSGGWTMTLAGRERRDRAGHDDPAGHPAGPRGAVARRTFAADGSGIDCVLPRGDRGGRRDAVRRGPGRPPERPGASTRPTPRALQRIRRRRRPGGRRAGLRPPARHRRRSCPAGTRSIAAWLPGTEGAGVADVLFGKVRADRQAAGDLAGLARPSSRSTPATARRRCSRSAPA